MSTITMKFNLPEESEEFNLTYHGANYYSVISETLHEIRKIVKYNSDQHSDEYIRALETIRAFIYEELNSRNLEV